MPALDLLRARLAELSDLSAMQMLAEWDQLVMMPAQAGAARAQQLGTLARLTHERATEARIGEWLDELRDAQLPEIDADLVRIARRDFERARMVPADLAVEMAQASAAGQEAWQAARAADDFASFVPALTRNVELARSYGSCVAAAGQRPYDALLFDYDWGLSSADLRPLFQALTSELPPLMELAAAHSPPRPMGVPVRAQKAAVQSVLARIGVEPTSWRVDVSAHPFSTWTARRDTRITTRYDDGNVESLLSSLHEYGHGLYERQVDPALERTNLASGTSMSVHESQSKLWENHVARSSAFAEVLAAELGAAGFHVTAGDLHATLVGVAPSLIRVSADPLTYPLHIVLRFELEHALIEGDLAVTDLPGAWRDAVKRLLGLDVPSDAQGCLQDIHWGAGSFGYFPSYALGCLIAAQLWEAMEVQIGSRDEHLRRGEVGELQAWLAEHVHRFGRRLDTIPLMRRATGEGLSVEPFLRYVAPLAGR